MRKILTSALAAMLLLASIWVAPVSANHYVNLAGRPLADSTGGSEAYNQSKCHGLTYGYVDGRKVLFIANHCINTRYYWNSPVGTKTFIDPDGHNIGNTPTTILETGHYHDLGFIYVTSHHWPTNPHQIYAGRDYLGNEKWTTNTYKLGSSNWGCTLMTGRIGYPAYEHHNNLYSQYAAPAWGHMTERFGGCKIRTTHPGSGTYRHSGAPLMNVAQGLSGALVGVGTDRVCYSGLDCDIFGPNDMLFSSVYEGIRDIRAYWLTHGTKKGAWFCGNAACTKP